MLEILNLSKKYRNSDKFSIEDVSFDVKDGEIFGFLGPNGAGKSTTIKCITGILPYSQGNIKVCGFDVKEKPIDAKMNIGFVPDNHLMYDKLTGREFINFKADMYGVGAEDRKTRAQDLLDMFELNDAYDKQISTYSHGMKQKMCVIGALVHKPKLWILDEPMMGLDPKSSRELKDLMRAHCKEGNSVFFSSHMLEVVEQLCDRIGIINNGKIVDICDMENLAQAKEKLSLEDFFLSMTSDKAVKDDITF
ncbi:MAG: ABC transporter ATP-binding protein [Clostridia bacterium]